MLEFTIKRSRYKSLQTTLAIIYLQTGLALIHLQTGLAMIYLQTGLAKISLQTGLTIIHLQTGLAIIYLQTGLAIIHLQTGLTIIYLQPGLASFNHSHSLHYSTATVLVYFKITICSIVGGSQLLRNPCPQPLHQLLLIFLFLLQSDRRWWSLPVSVVQLETLGFLVWTSVFW